MVEVKGSLFHLFPSSVCNYMYTVTCLVVTYRFLSICQPQPPYPLQSKSLVHHFPSSICNYMHTATCLVVTYRFLSSLSGPFSRSLRTPHRVRISFISFPHLLFHVFIFINRIRKFLLKCIILLYTSPLNFLCQ